MSPDEGSADVRELEEAPGPGSAPAIDEAPVIVPDATWDDEERRRRLKPWAIAAAIGVGLITGSVTLSYTSLFGARVVEVEGEERLGPKQVMRLAQVEVGTNVLHLDESMAEARLEQEPWIRDATVRSSLPGTISIVIHERVPVLVLRSGSGGQFAAADGTLLGRAPGTTAFPEVVLPQGMPLRRETIVAMADVVDAMVPTLRTRVDSVSIADDGAVSMVVDGDVEVSYGSPTDPLVKAQALRAILDYSQREERELVSIDLSTPGAPTARFVGSQAPVTVPDPSADVSSPDDDAVEPDGASVEPSSSP
jgi:cell division protein FtsQ